MRAITESDLSEIDLQRLLKMPHSIRQETHGSLLAGIGEGEEPNELWLWHRQMRTCWYFKALHEYEAWVTTGPTPDSPQYPIDELALHIRREKDGADYWHPGQNVQYWAKTDEILHTGGACGWSACFAKATMWGISWTTTEGVIS